MEIDNEFKLYKDAFFFCEYHVNPDLYWCELNIDQKKDLILRMKEKYKTEIEDKKYIELREQEYPKWKEFMHEFFDGNVENIRIKRERIKLKYPKPI